DFGLDLCAVGIRLRKDCRDLLVGEAALDPNRRVGKADRRALTRRGKVHERGLHVARSALLEAREGIGNGLGKHGQDALRQINTGPALSRLAIDGAAGWSKVADVG